jgi:hypothetical protein
MPKLIARRSSDSPDLFYIQISLNILFTSPMTALSWYSVLGEEEDWSKVSLEDLCFLLEPSAIREQEKEKCREWHNWSLTATTYQRDNGMSFSCLDDDKHVHVVMDAGHEQSVCLKFGRGFPGLLPRLFMKAGSDGWRQRQKRIITGKCIADRLFVAQTAHGFLIGMSMDIVPIPEALKAAPMGQCPSYGSSMPLLARLIMD